MSRNYWKTCHQEALTRFIRSTNHAERNRIIDRELSPALYELANRSLTSFNLHVNPEQSQDIVIHLLYKVIPNLSEDKLKGAQAYLWTSATNYVKSYILVKPKYDIVNIDTLFAASEFDSGEANMYGSDSYSQKMYLPDQIGPYEEPIDLEEGAELAATQKKIIEEINSMIRATTVTNATTGVFLLFLKDYILDNDFDVRGFGEHVRREMRISLHMFRTVAGRNRIRTLFLNKTKT